MDDSDFRGRKEVRLPRDTTAKDLSNRLDSLQYQPPTKALLDHTASSPPSEDLSRRLERLLQDSAAMAQRLDQAD